MSVTTIDAKIMSRMFLAGAKNLQAKKEWINELNVFPVPDGDTGTNMTLTIMSAAAEVSKLGEAPSMDALAKAISSGSLRGARGNSGVILSQLLRGFTKVMKKYDEMNSEAIAEAMEKGIETAYKAVMKPKEGTILTVAREAASKAKEIAAEVTDLNEFFQDVFLEAQNTLEKTPDMLPVLKEAGVVDSGGQGLVEVYRGIIDGFLGKESDFSIPLSEKPAPMVNKISAEAEAEIRFGYCTEFIVLLNKPLTEEEEYSFKDFLLSIGDSIVLVADDEIVKVHVHTNHPGLAFEEGLKFGALSRMKVDNMREEHQEKLIKDAEKLAKEQAAADAKARAVKKEPEKEVGFISVSVGEGMSNIFKDLGVDYLIEGGQTMNPSTEDVLNAIDQVNAKNIFVFPNNKNIVLAANQARDLTEDKNIIVVPTKTIPQGITAMINYAPEKSAEENEELMQEAITMVKTGQITYAVRNTHIEDKEIHEGDIMGIGDKGMLAVGNGIDEIAEETIDKMIDEDCEVISIYFGKDISEERAQSFGDKIQEKYPDMEVEVNEGGQPIYYYVISVE